MAFDSLSEKLQKVFDKLRGKGRLSESDVKEAMREVKMALLEADVSFKVVKSFIASTTERAVGTDVLNSLTPGQMVIKIVNDEMKKLMGDEITRIELKPSNEITTIMMCGLQGAGKTTMAAKLAGKFKSQGRKPLLVACDIYRPAAIEQLQINAGKVGVDCFSMGTNHPPVDIVKAALSHASQNGENVVIIDTAGRLHIDEEMMNELVTVKEKLSIDHTILTVDSMTGQDAVNVAEAFNSKLTVTGVILTKLDGDTRGGAALSIKAVTGRPILYVGTGEKLTDIEEFYPDRMASRILGMGDILTLIDKAQEQFDEEKAKELEKKIRKQEFDFNDYLDQIKNMKKMGGLGKIMEMLPGMGMGNMNLKGVDTDAAEDNLKTVETIINSMTKAERANPDLLNPSRKNRISRGSGVDIADVNRMVKQFLETRKMMKQFTGMMGGKGKKGFRLPFGKKFGF